MLITEGKKKIFGKDFLVIAHRGASYDAPENTFAAFQLAHRLKADMIELDVQLSSDGIPVVFHDARLDNKTNGKGAVSDYCLRELRMLDAGSWFSASFIDERILSLAEVLDWAQNKIALNIEIKPEAVTHNAQNGIEEKTTRLVKEFGMEKKVIISSFDYRAIRRIKTFSPLMKTGLLYHKKGSKEKDYAKLTDQYGADFFHCSRSEIAANSVNSLLNAGIPFLIYTVNSANIMRKLIRIGASGIFTDKPGLLRRVYAKE